MSLPRYFPFMHGVYDVKAGISALGKDFGNGVLDRRVFQLDEQFDLYLSAKRHAASHAGEYVLRDGLSDEAERAVAGWMAGRLAAEYPGCGVVSAGDWGSLDAVSMMIQSDMAVLEIDGLGHNRLSYLNVAMPSGWSPREKIGKSFDAVHAPVPHIDSVSAKQDSIAKLMVNATRGAVRFAWTVTTDASLNHHPGRDLSHAHASPLADHPSGEPLLRVERQVIWGFPEHRAALFLIRTYLYAFEWLEPAVRRALAQAVSGMSEASLSYKNMDRGRIVDRLGGI